LTHTGFEPHGLTKKATRLYPPPAREIPAEAIYEDLELPPKERQDPSRPYVVINVVSSIDGKTAIGGKASRIGSETDRRVMRTLRSKVDAVMIGANTLRAERLSLGLDEPNECARPQPLAVIITETGDLPLESKLVDYERQKVLVIAPEQHAQRFRGRACVLAAPPGHSGALDLRDVMRRLKASYSVYVLLVEGGPSLNHSLVSNQLADELFVTLSPKLLGGPPSETLTMLNGPLLSAGTSLASTLLSVHLADSEVFLRYSLSRTGHPL
jgi:2,5-diamino-6-(ribosylamino)-4(3H)-pyrimidinone 5'-phosphate reductase